MLFFAVKILLLLSLCAVPVIGGGYEVWASDQSNSVPGQTALGVLGSFLWIFDSSTIETQLSGGPDAVSLPCTPGATEGPCDVMEVFPQDLRGFKRGEGIVGTLGDLNGFGRLHGVIKDPQEKYVVANFFAPAGGYVGIIDVETKEAIGLFRVTKFKYKTGTSATVENRSVHMSFWDAHDGSYILVANLNGKAIERINVVRDANDKIVSLQFDQSATLGLGREMVATDGAVAFKGNNAFGNKLIGTVVGNYRLADLGDLTPNGVCKENGCTGALDGEMGGRPNNVLICPIASKNDLVYITHGGGGMFVADITTTPIKIVAEYGNQVIYGAGCGGVNTPDGQMFMNAGVSASGAGATQSMFGIWSFDDAKFREQDFFAQNEPMPTLVYEDATTNTLTLGNQNGHAVENNSGQIPGETTRRDSHGLDVTVDGKYLHVVDRIQNKVEVFDVLDDSYGRSTYYLTTLDGSDSVATAGAGACAAKSVTDDDDLPSNDPAPDLLERTPDGKYLMIAFRGPAPVSVNHSAQGSCPGVGVVELTESGKSGKLIAVLRTTNSVTDSVTVSIPGGHDYIGAERSDIHGAIVVST